MMTFGNNGPNVYKTSLAAKFEQNQSILMYSVICPNQHRGIIAKVWKAAPNIFPVIVNWADRSFSSAVSLELCIFWYLQILLLSVLAIHYICGGCRGHLCSFLGKFLRKPQWLANVVLLVKFFQQLGISLGLFGLSLHKVIHYETIRFVLCPELLNTKCKNVSK